MRLKRLRVLTYCLFLSYLFGFFQILFGEFDLKNILKEPKAKENTEDSSVPQKEGLRATQTIITSSVEESSVYSQPIVFFAYVAPIHLPAITPTGTIQFEVDHAPVSTQPLVNGTAKFIISNLPSTLLKQHHITAIYSGDEIYESSRDYWDLWIYPAKTTSFITAWPNPSLLGQSVKFTVTVDANVPAKATPNGSVELFIDGSSFAIATLNARGKAIFSTAEIAVGTHTITAIYKGTENFQPSQVNFTQQVNKTHTQIELTSSENPSVFGQAIVFTATVASSAGIPTGMVQFMINGSNYGNPLSLDSNGQAIITLKDLSSSSYTIEADYLGDANFNSSHIFLTQTIDQAKTKTALTTGENPSTYGTALNVTVKVSSETAQPTGWIRFKIDGKEFNGTHTLPKNGQISITLNQLTAGSHQIEAEYSGDNNFIPSADSVIQQVKKAKTTGLTSSQNPSVYGNPIKITATVKAEGLQPTGLVQFKIDGRNFEEAQVLKNGKTSIVIQHLRAGSHQIEADYLGNENFSSANVILVQHINKADTSTTVSSSANPSILGEPVTFTAAVAAREMLSGTIQFQIDGENIGDPLVVNHNQAALTISKGLKRGEQQIVAIYSGNENFNSSTSPPLMQVANLAVFPPTLVTGFQINNVEGAEVKWINVLRWHPPAKREVPVAYRIYRDAELKVFVATISANQELEFIDPIRRLEPFYNYFIVSVDALGNESEPASLKVIPRT
jgi:hypothetical protein